MSLSYTTTMTKEEFYNQFGFYPTKKRYEWFEAHYQPIRRCYSE